MMFLHLCPVSLEFDAVPPTQTKAGEKMRTGVVELVGKLQHEEGALATAQNDLPALDDGASKADIAVKESKRRLEDLTSQLKVVQGIIGHRRPIVAKVASSPLRVARAVPAR